MNIDARRDYLLECLGEIEVALCDPLLDDADHDYLDGEANRIEAELDLLDGVERGTHGMDGQGEIFEYGAPCPSLNDAWELDRLRGEAVIAHLGSL